MAEEVDGWNAIGPSKPTHRLLYNCVIPRVASKWHELGIGLYKDADVPRLDIIQKERPGEFERACREMLTYWLNTYTNANWNRLIKALRAPSLQLNSIALDIMRDVIQDQMKDDDSVVPTVTGTAAVTGTPAVDILSEKDDNSGDTPAVEKLTHGVDKLSEITPELKGSSSTYVSSTSTNLWTRPCCSLAIVVCVAAVVIAFALRLIVIEYDTMGDVIQDRTKDDDSVVPTVTGTAAVTGTPTVDILSESIPSWFYQTQLCYQWRADGNGGQCGAGEPQKLCAYVGSKTQYYRDDTDRRSGGCRMQWGILSPNAESWFKSVQICYRWYADGNGGQCGGGAPASQCASIGSFTQEYRDDTDGRSGGCRMSWKLSVPGSSPQWLRNMSLCYEWYADGNGGQCGGGVSQRLCAIANSWTTYYRDDTDGRSGGCRMSWGLYL